MGKLKKHITNDKPKSSSNKNALIRALEPLCNDFPWLKNLYTNKKIALLIENDFELSGLLRKITYELLKVNPHLFDNKDAKTAPLLDLMDQLFDNIKVLNNTKENLAKTFAKIYHRNQQLKTEKKSRF